MATLEALPCFEVPCMHYGDNPRAGTEQHERVERVVILQHNEWTIFFHSSDQIFIHLFSFFINEKSEHEPYTYHSFFSSSAKIIIVF
jgi:hypothetical protein